MITLFYSKHFDDINRIFFSQFWVSALHNFETSDVFLLYSLLKQWSKTPMNKLEIHFGLSQFVIGCYINHNIQSYDFLGVYLKDMLTLLKIGIY